MRSTTRIFALVASFAMVACSATGTLFAQTGPREIWVLLEAGSIAVIDTSDNSVAAARIDVADADGDTLLDTPRDLCFSTLPGAPGTHAFVTQGRFVTVVDVATHTRLFSKEIGQFASTPLAELNGCAAAAPFEADDPAAGGSVLETDLFVAGTSTSGDALWFALDQQALISTAPIDPVRDDGILATGAAGGFVEALELDSGAAARRAIFSALRSDAAGDEVLAIRLSGTKTTPADWTVDSQRVFPAPAGAATAVRPGAPFGGELPAFPVGSGLHNLDTGGSCTLSGTFSAISISGAGQDSYAIFALDFAAGTVHVVEPYDCLSQPVAVAAGPVDLVTLGEFPWRALFVAEHDGDSVSRIDPDGTRTPIPIGTGGGVCTDCPVAIGLAAEPRCVPGREQSWARIDHDGDGMFDDLRIEFDFDGCPVAGPFTVWCRALDLDAHPDCFCDCSLGPSPGCDCPPVLSDFAFAGMGGGATLATDDDEIIKDTPWKKLGISKDGSFVHEDGANFGDTQYDVSMDDSPPGN